MKNILNIAKYDAKKLTSSVVAIIVIMGLCIIPCLYAWFNIFSNWAPYESDATGRILVAVANEDSGAELLGIDVNVGDTINESLKANDSIGWRFVDSKEEALEGVYAGDYYAALVIPEDFSMNVMSFVTGDITNPKLLYYENEKKNAIAPKITGKAKTAVQEQVNATFVETLAAYVSDAASVIEASGYDPRTVFSDLSDKMDLLNERLDDAAVMISAVQGLADSADSLMSVSDQLLGSTEVVVESQAALLDSAVDIVPKTDSSLDKEVAKAIEKEKKAMDEDFEALIQDIDTLNKNIQELNKDIEDKTGGVDAFNKYLEENLPDNKALLENMRQSAERTEKYLEDLGYTGLAKEFRETRERIEELQKDFENQKPITNEEIDEKLAELDNITAKMEDARKKVNDISTKEIENLDKDLKKAIANARASITNVQNTISGMEGSLADLSDILGSYGKSLAKLENSLNSTNVSLGYTQSGLKALAAIFDRIAGNETLDDVGDVLANDEASVAEYLASPVRMKTEVIYPIETYGSQMAPFYTVLAQWVGALLTAVLVKTRVRKREELENLKRREAFFGRYGIYLFVGLAQALIVSLGDLLYVGIQCEHPVLFVLQALMNGVTFMLINYALVFALENVGLAIGVVILVLQVAGSGGTYPVEVVPKIFQIIYPYMPFKYSMTAMRECIGGMYENTYSQCMLMLVVFCVAAVILGQILQRPAKWLNRLIEESKAKTEIML